MTDSNSVSDEDIQAIARDYLDAWQRHLSEMARDAELPAVIGRLYAQNAADPETIVEGFDGWNEAWRKMIKQMAPQTPEGGDEQG